MAEWICPFCRRRFGLMADPAKNQAVQKKHVGYHAAALIEEIEKHLYGAVDKKK